MELWIELMQSAIIMVKQLHLLVFCMNKNYESRPKGQESFQLEMRRMILLIIVNK